MLIGAACLLAFIVFACYKSQDESQVTLADFFFLGLLALGAFALLSAR